MSGISLWHWLVVLVLVPLHFAPTIVAFMRKHSKRWWVFAINFFLGWTVVGWVAALVWAILGRAREELAIDKAAFD